MTRRPPKTHLYGHTRHSRERCTLYELDPEAILCALDLEHQQSVEPNTGHQDHRIYLDGQSVRVIIAAKRIKTLYPKAADKFQRHEARRRSKSEKKVETQIARVAEKGRNMRNGARGTGRRY
jgi:hypothetical protein